MYILMLSRNKKFPLSMIALVDKIIVKERFRNLSLYSFHTCTMEELKKFQYLNSYCYILIDSQSYPDIISVLSQLERIMPHYVAGILADSERNAVNLLNSHFLIYGFVNIWEENLEERLKDILSFLNRNYKKGLHGICVKEGELTNVIPYSNIYFIETEKGTHRCMIYHTEGVASIRDNIKDLIQKLDLRFLQVRSSTIVNMERIIHMNLKKRVIFFSDTLLCTFAQEHIKEIRQWIQPTKVNNTRHSK